MTLKESLDAANTRAGELEATIAAHEAAIAEKDEKISELEGKVAELTGKAEAQAAAIETNESKITQLEGENAELITRAENAEGEVTRLTTEAKSADERAREIAARHSADLPPKQPGAGDKTTEPRAVGSPSERLAAHINAQFEKK